MEICIVRLVVVQAAVHDVIALHSPDCLVEGKNIKLHTLVFIDISTSSIPAITFRTFLKRSLTH
jgi:diphthamide biosynthesis methyltransferase